MKQRKKLFLLHVWVEKRLSNTRSLREPASFAWEGVNGKGGDGEGEGWWRG